MNFDTNRVLVTGGAGWLGRGLVNALRQGIPECDSIGSPQVNLGIRALVLPHEAEAFARDFEEVDVHVGDLTRSDDCRDFADAQDGAVLFHTAGVIHPTRVAQFYEINVEGTRNLLAAAAGSGIRRAVVMSSNSPLGCNPHPDHRFDEASEYHPYMNYGKSKWQMELLIREFSETTDMEIVTIRAPWFYGPYQPARQNLFFKMIRDGGAPIVGGGDNLRSMAYIDNLVQGLILAATVPGAAGRTFWIADTEPYSMNQIVDTVERLLEEEFGQKCAHSRLRLPGVVSEIAYAADWMLQSIGVYQQKVHVLSEMNKTIACTVEKARQELGYEPTVSLEEGMRRSLKWMFEQCSCALD